jgi:hypothetical protein
MHQTDIPIRHETPPAGSVLPAVHVDWMAASGEVERETQRASKPPQSTGKAVSSQQGDAH